MSEKDSVIQPSFAAGELAPALAARIDLSKSHVGLKLGRNVFVHPDGGFSNRPGTAFIGRAKDSANPVRVIRFQFSTLQSYTLEFGHQYMRVIMDGGYVLEPSQAIVSVSNGAPGVLRVPAHGFAVGDQVFISGATGMTQLNSTPGRQYLVATAGADSLRLTDLDGAPVVTAAWPSYGGSGTIARVFTLATPYAGADLALLKFTQSADVLTLTHPGYPTMDLSRLQHWIWTLTAITFAPSVKPPSGVTVAPSSGGSWYFSYMVTANTASPPEESEGSAAAVCVNAELNQNTGVQNTIGWPATRRIDSYRIYKATPVYNAAVATGAMHGYIGTATGTAFTDTNISPDFTQTPPQGTNPFPTGAIADVKVQSGGKAYNGAVTLTVADPTGRGAVLTPTLSGGQIAAVTVDAGGVDYSNPVIIVSSGAGTGAVIALVTADDGQTHLVNDDDDGWLRRVSNGTLKIIGAYVKIAGKNYTAPTATVIDLGGSGAGAQLSLSVTNGEVSGVAVVASGLNYSRPGAIVSDTPSGAGAVLTAQVSATANAPGVATYYEQRKVFARGTTAPQTLWLTQSAAFNNMDVSDPVRDSDAITVTIASRQVDEIRWLVPLNCMLVLTSGGVWKVSAGGSSSVLTPAQTVVTPQSYAGAANVPPLVIGFDVLYVQAQGASIRDLSYNFYADMFTSAELSVLSSHLFYGYQITDWAYAAEPHKLVWAVRNDGHLISLTYLKEQDVYGFTHCDTPGNSGADMVQSVCTTSEPPEDALYMVVQRTIPGINGGQPVKYIERLASRNFMTTAWEWDITLAWFLDCALQYCGTPTQTVSGLDHLNGCTVNALADGYVKKGLLVEGGRITLDMPASIVTVGLPYPAQAMPLPFDIGGQTTIQGKRKNISAVTMRVLNSRGMKIGREGKLRDVRTPPPDNWGTALPVFTGDIRQVLDPAWVKDGTYLIQQDDPLPMTILGLIPEVVIGDTPG